MGKNAHHKEKQDAKRAIKNKKKFKNRNSIGKAKQKTGSAGRFMTRTTAVAKLQVPLKDFRKLCILKGVYPREPKKKFKGTNTTYFFAKDIQFLMHEPILNKFREQKAFLKKIRKASGRHERKRAETLEGRKPVYKLDHLIRERYPSFTDALQDLDDALCLIMLFASLSPSKYVPAKRVQTCARLRREFLAYVAKTRSLRHTFISIKGIYYQAEVHGVTLTWVEPHHGFAQQPTMTVDYRVMLSFLELYEAVVTFVNFKLYHDLGMAYPPPLNANADDAGVHLAANLFVPKAGAGDGAAPPKQLTAAAGIETAPPPRGGASTKAAPTASQLAALKGKLSRVEGDDDDDDGANGAVADGGDAVDDDDDEDGPETAALRRLFTSCYFFCGRETPVPALELLIVSCGGHVGWEGDASPFGVGDACVTHHVVDRPYAVDGGAAQNATRSHVQPQWVFDCVNARTLLPTYGYRPGVTCPPHLSPFGDGSEGYTPAERMLREARDAAVRDANGAEEGSEEEGEESEEDEIEGEDAEDEEEDEGEEEDDDEEDDEEEEEAAPPPSSKKKRKAGDGPAAMTQEEEEKALRIMMMNKKKRKLYDRMQYGIQKKKEAADVLRKKREALDKKSK